LAISPPLPAAAAEEEAEDEDDEDDHDDDPENSCAYNHEFLLLGVKPLRVRREET
jgi:hypothetical protein